MITKFTITNFKRLASAELELGNASIFIGPNNSGKTTALQALALWDIGWRRWSKNAKKEKSAPNKDLENVWGLLLIVAIYIQFRCRAHDYSGMICVHKLIVRLIKNKVLERYIFVFGQKEFMRINHGFVP